MIEVHAVVIAVSRSVDTGVMSYHCNEASCRNTRRWTVQLSDGLQRSESFSVSFHLYSV